LPFRPCQNKMPASLRKDAGPVSALAFCLHGTRLASGSSDGKVLVWDLRR